MYDKLIDLLDAEGANYRVLDHAPEGRTDLVSELRGNALAQAAKCVVVMVKIGKRARRHVLAVVPGDRRVDLAGLKHLLGGSYAAFAPQDVAEALAGSASGTILPFTWHPDLELIVDPALVEQDELYFNAARLDRSIALSANDYVAITRPRFERIAEAGSTP
ncbi:YbaK/EbsC family protein [Allokutzneria sp. NRRL B-24872]|uniref:YbaK/EbsC family protein n=1 Tax=Allokutzneria sp. NRRL B-24872 TaxID=1137961 RepID=UPI000A380734|nr:YbaK/EbsC family protein [Allokutzneria sp. NRRL B-24872]